MSIKSLFSRSTLFLVSLLLIPAAGAQGQTLDEELRLLDANLAMAPEYFKNKETLIKSLESLLNYPNTSMDQKFTIYGQLFNENYSYSFDSALSAIENQEDIAKSLGERQRQQVAIDKVLLYTTAGMYLEAKEFLDTQIDTTKLHDELKPAYYYTMQRFWKDYAEYSELNDKNETVSYYRDKYLEVTDEDDFKHRQLIIFNLMDQGRNEEANELNTALLASLDSVSHEYAIMAYYQGLISEHMGNPEGRLHWLIKSAIVDIKNGVRDYASLSSIATDMLDTDVERSSHYIQTSIEDALFYNAKLRPLQIARLMPSIDNAYKKKQEESQIKASKRNTQLAIMTGLLLTVGFLLAIVLKRQTSLKKELQDEIKKSEEEKAVLASQNKAVTEAFEKLAASNNTKKEQIVALLGQCNSYLDKAKKNMTPEQKEAELKQYYTNFDNAFLQMYPTFVEDFNALLKPDQRIELKKDDILTTELRIFALIRLGVTQSSTIASLLRYSVNTIYNYRAQIKNAALDEREDFEKNVKKIGNIEF